MLKESYRVLDRLRKPHGLYVASQSNHYDYVWIRDSVYMSLPYLHKNDGKFELAYHRLFDLFREYEWKLDFIIKQRPHLEWEYIHARYSADDVKEIHDQEWGHNQHDMIGSFLFGVGQGEQAGRDVLRDSKDREILQKLVYYLQSVEYWHDPDNGMWEEWQEIHASSVGACVAGLKAIRSLVNVPEQLINHGIDELIRLYPRESNDKEVDLAQLSLIYPYQIFTGPLAERIVRQVERKLLRQNGVVRYEGDSYYSTLERDHGREKPRSFYYGTEAEWTFGLPWLALCHHMLGNQEMAHQYLKRTEHVMLADAVLPELYYSGTHTPNPNTPLGWSSAMYILAYEALHKR